MTIIRIDKRHVKALSGKPKKKPEFNTIYQNLTEFIPWE